jgi:hypothetical protein
VGSSMAACRQEAAVGGASRLSISFCEQTDVARESTSKIGKIIRFVAGITSLHIAPKSSVCCSSDGRRQALSHQALTLARFRKVLNKGGHDCDWAGPGTYRSTPLRKVLARDRNQHEDSGLGSIEESLRAPSSPLVEPLEDQLIAEPDLDDSHLKATPFGKPEEPPSSPLPPPQSFLDATAAPPHLDWRASGREYWKLLKLNKALIAFAVVANLASTLVSTSLHQLLELHVNKDLAKFLNSAVLLGLKGCMWAQYN